MQTEEEILEEKSHVLDEALDTAEIPDHTVKIDEDVARQMQVAIEQIGILSDLHCTINEEGISRHDISVLKGVHASMESIGIQMPIGVSLESDGMFTPMRSSVNMQAGNGSILKTIVATIKEWFYKLVDFVAKVIQWFKARKYSDAQIEGRIKAAQLQLDAARSSFITLEKTSNLSNRDLTPRYETIAGELLSDVRLPKSVMTLVAFGIDEHAGALRRKLDSVQALSKKLLDEITELRDFLLGKRLDLNFSNSTGDQIQALAKDIADFNIESDDPNFFLKNKFLGLRFYEDLTLIKRRKAFSIEFVYSTYVTCADELRKIRRFELDENKLPVEHFQAAFDSILKSLVSLREIIDAFQKLSIAQWKATATYINFYLTAYEITKQDRSEYLSEDIVRVTVKKLDEKMDQIKASLGI